MREFKKFGILLLIILTLSFCAPIDQKVDNLIKQGKYEEANKIMEGVYPTHIQDAKYNYLYAKTFIYLKKFKKAEKFFKKALNLDPNMSQKIAQDLYEAAKTFANKGDYESANYLIASGIMKNKDLKDEISKWAYENWMKQEDKTTDVANFYFELLKRYYGQKKLVSKLEEMEKEARYSKNWKKAFTLVDLIIDAVPAKVDTKDFYKRYIMYLEKFENFDKVNSTYEQIINTFPDDEEIALNHIIYLLINNKTREALPLIEDAMATFPKSNKPFILKAILNLKRNLSVLAKKDFKRALKIKSQKDNFYQNYIFAIYYSLIKNKKKALSYIENVLKLNPEYVFRIEDNPLFENIKSDENFKNLINKTLESLKNSINQPA